MDELRKPISIAVGNQKGGVGKTTNTVHIATALAERGRKVLIIDLDMNRGATRHFGIPSESFLGAFEVLIGEEQPEDVIITNEDEGVEMPENVHLIAARRNLENVEKTLLAANKFRIIQDILIRPLKTLEGTYDYVFLDTAPNATPPTIAAYKAAQFFLLTALPEPFAIEGLNDALADIRDAQRNGNPQLRLLGVVLAAVDGRKTRLTKSLTEYVEQQFATGGGATAKFETTISRSTHIPEAQKVGKTLFQTDPTHKVCDQYRQLAEEIEVRLGKTAPKPEHLTSDVTTTTDEAITEALGNG